MKILSTLSILSALLSLTSLAETTISKPNILLICVDDLRPELGCYGREHMHTPHIDKLASQGRLFSRHYVSAPTCGVSRFSLLTGRHPRGQSDLKNTVIADRSSSNTLPPTIPQVFKNNGYSTIAIGKVSHYPGGLYGKDWNDPTKVEIPDAWSENLMPNGDWKNPKNAMHGVANGVPRIRKQTPAIEIAKGDDTIYPDGLITNSATEKIAELSKNEKPWFLAVGLIKPHLPFTAPQPYWDLYDGQKLPVVLHPEKPERDLTWSRSGEFLNYNHEGKDPRKDSEYAALLRRHYYASVSYADAQVGKILTSLEKSGQSKNTIVVLWGDHGWNLGERNIWGKHNLYEEALHAPLIIHIPNIKEPGVAANAIAETTDIFPTLCALSDIQPPEGLDGDSLTPQLQNPKAPSDDIASSFWNHAQTIRTDNKRLTRVIKNDETHYNLFLFPESQAPNSEQLTEATRELSGHFLKP